MKIIIPMAGKGKRFEKYLIPKPLIEIDGKPMIEHVINCFPRKSEFIFLCHDDHLSKTNMGDILKKIDPNCKIIGVSDDYLGGPAKTCVAAFDCINDDEEVIVNYCDFIQIWNYDEFIRNIKKTKADGAIPSFRGFHPSSLGSTYYAYLNVNKENFIDEVSEKKSFSKDRTNDFASTGTYYFSSGKLLKKYIQELISKKENAVKGEFYMSLPYNLMIKDKLKILNYEVEKFICLGTPRDYELYKFWSEFFLDYSPRLISFDNINLNVINIFPLASGDSDFKEIGFNGPNFMLPIMNKTLINYSLKSNPKGIKNIFIGLENEKKYFEDSELFNRYNSEVAFLKERKNGNAATIHEVKDKIDPESPICVCGVTYLLKYNERKMANLMEQEGIDIILFSFSHHECILRDPTAFAYAKIKNDIEVEYISEKEIISDNPYTDQALTGTAIFKKSKYLFDSIKEELDKSKDKKLYFLTCVNNLLKKLKIVIFEVDKFVPVRWVTNYKEFIYWQDYFDKLSYHPYSKMLQ